MISAEDEQFIRAIIHEEIKNLDYGSLLTVKEGAEKLRVSEKTLYGMVAKREIDHVRIRKGIFFEPDMINSYVERQTVKARA